MVEETPPVTAEPIVTPTLTTNGTTQNGHSESQRVRVGHDDAGGDYDTEEEEIQEKKDIEEVPNEVIADDEGWAWKRKLVWIVADRCEQTCWTTTRWMLRFDGPCCVD